jgi:hypothetical protein
MKKHMTNIAHGAVAGTLVALALFGPIIIGVV